MTENNSTGSATPSQPSTSSPSASTSPANQTRTTPAMKDIFHAIRRNKLDAVKQFVEEKGVPITQTDKGVKSGAIIAAELGHLPILKYFLEKNSTLLTVTDLAGNTVLQNAIQKGDLAMVKYLVDERKADILAIDHHINTAVHVAALEGQLDILKYFIEEKKADVNIRNLNGETPLFVAAEKPFMYVIFYLVEERRADPTLTDLTKDNILYKSAAHNDLLVPKYLLDTKKVQFDVNSKNTLGYTVVNWASRFNGTDFIKYMVNQKNADVNMPDTKMVRTPLHQAALTNNMALCKFLVEHGAKRDAKDKHGKTPAEVANNPEVAEYLNSTTTSRKRRSLIDTMNIPHKEVSMMKYMSGNVQQYQRSLVGGNQETAVQQDVAANGGGALNGLLTVVDTAVRYMKGSSGYQQVEHQSFQSPQEYLRGRMDPVAIYSINRLVPVLEE